MTAYHALREGAPGARPPRPPRWLYPGAAGVFSVSPDDANLVEHEDACPLCGERRADMLEWIDDDRVRCSMCCQEYRPGSARPQ